VRKSYADPLETFETNMMGTAHLLESLRTVNSVRSVVVVTTDKCYENLESERGYRESDALGGYDPYSSSKAGTEIIANAYRSSFFNPHDYADHKVAIATARAGNVIGGGDWSAERLIPDLLRSIIRAEPLELRNPDSSRPWQHVLEPLHGYLLLAEKLFEYGPVFSGAWNFGPDLGDHIRVEDVIALLQTELGTSVALTKAKGPQPHETNLLRLDSSKARENLGWKPQLSVKESLKLTAQWVRLYLEKADMRQVTRGQIEDFAAFKAS
jgi:CDP-glucose 4,6-dehydratase